MIRWRGGFATTALLVAVIAVISVRPSPPRAAVKETGHRGSISYRI